MTYLSLEGLRYYFTEAGSGIPVLLLHGFTGSSENWGDLVGPLSTSYRVISVDLPGHGLTNSPAEISRYSIENVAQQLIQLLDHLGASPAHWLGYSMGGRLALYAALNFPESFLSLTLESGTAGIVDYEERQERRRHDNSLADFIEKEGIPAFVDYWERLPIFASQMA